MESDPLFILQDKHADKEERIVDLILLSLALLYECHLPTMAGEVL